MAPPFPIAATSEADDIRKLDATAGNVDRILLKELISPSMLLHRSPLQPSSPTVCVHGYGSLQFIIGQDMDRLLVITIPKHGNGGITFLATATKLPSNPFEHLVPWINFKDNSGVERNFQQYGVMARTVFTKVTGYATTSTYISGLCSGTTVADLRNVESYTREGLENATMHLPDFIKDELTTCHGIVNVQGPEGMTTIADQNTTITELEKSWYRHTTFMQIFIAGTEQTQIVFNWSCDPDFVENSAYFNPNYPVANKCDWTVMPAPMINPTIIGNVNVTPNTSTANTIFPGNVRVMITYLYSSDGINTTLSTTTLIYPVQASFVSQASFRLRPEDYAADMNMDENSDGPVVNVIAVCITMNNEDGISNSFNIECDVKLGGARDPFDFTSYASICLLQQLQAGVAFSVESTVDYVAIPNKISRNLLTSVGAQNTPNTNAGETLIDYAKAMQLALFYFDGIGGMRCHTATDYAEILENVSYMGETHVNNRIAEASSGRRIRKFFKQAGKTVFKDVLRPIASHTPQILNTVSNLAQMSSPTGSLAKNAGAAARLFSGMGSIASE